MAIDSRIGTKINKSLRTDLAPATNISPFPYIGIVKNNLDPTRCGRVQVFIPELGGNPDDPSNWRTISYASPFMGYTSTEINQTDVQNNKESFTNVTHTYGMWMVPPDIGVEVICMFIAGDPMRGYWVACVNSNLSRYMLPGLAGSTNVNSTFATANAKASYTPGDQLPVVEFNENIPANETNSNFYNAPKPIHETQYAVLKQQGLDRDTVRGTISSSSQRETPSQVFGISTPGRPLNDPADDPNYVRKLNAGTLTEDYYRVKSRKGGHTFVMDDGSVLGVDQLVRLRTAGGHQILMHDTEQTIYIGQSQGNSWIELTRDGSINLFSHGGLNLRSEGDINFHSDGNINLNADKHLNLHANKISNVAATYSLPDTSFNSNTGTWNSTNNQLNSIATVAPTHEPFDRIIVANTSELSSSIFVDTNQLIEANVGMKGYVDSVASQSTYGDSNVNAYLTHFDGNIIPSANLIYSLGNITHQWKDLFVGNSTIYVGGAPVSVDSTGNLTVNGTVIPTIGYVNARVSDIGGSSYGNANVAAYLIANNYLTEASANLSLYVWNANVTAANIGMKGYVDDSVSTANIGIIGYIDQGNSIQSAAISAANIGLKGYVDDALSTANVGIKGYIDLANSIQSAQITAANVGIIGYIDQGNSIQATAITAANIGMKGYVDNSVSTANIGMKGYVDSVASQSLYGNVNVKAYAETMGFTNYSNVNVAAYLSTNSYLTTTTANLSTYAYNANVTAANVGMKGYVDSLVGGGSYGNANVASYLAATQITVANIKLAPSGNIVFADGTVQTTAGGGSYSNVQVAAFLPTYNGVLGSSNLQVAGGTNISGTLVIGAGGHINSGGNILATGGILNSLTVNGNISGNTAGFSIGYRDLPQVIASNVTLALADASKHFYANTTAPTTITVPSNVNVAFPIGTTIVIVNRGSGNITIQNQSEGAPFLYLAGNATTTTSRTLTQYGMATLVKTETNLWFVNGTGVV